MESIEPVLSSPPTIHDTHPLWEASNSPEWTEQEIARRAISEARSSLHDALETRNTPSINQIDRDDSGTLPVLTVSLNTNAIERDSLLADVIRHHNAEIHAPRPTREDTSNPVELEFDLFTPPEHRPGSISRVQTSGTEPPSKYLTITGAVDWAGFDVGQQVTVTARSGEVRLHPADQYPAYKPRRHVTGAPHERFDSALEQFLKVTDALSEGRVVDSNRVPPAVQLRCYIDDLPVLQYKLSTTSTRIESVEISNPGHGVPATVVATVRVYPSFTQELGDGQRTVKLRETGDSTVATLTHALDQSGLDSFSSNERLAVFARPGEIRVVSATETL